jgi:hypothetical protein
MSETWSSLLAGVVGAIVGGAASLAGTMVVNKRQMATNARMRLYDELLPNLASRIDVMLDGTDYETRDVAEKQVPQLVEAVRRASAITGRLERQDAHNLSRLWGEHQAETDAENKAWEEKIRTLGPPEAVNADPDPPPGYKPPPSPYELRLRRIREEIRAFSDKLGAKLG